MISRLIHTTVEVLGSLVMAGGLLFGGFRLLCLGHNHCDSFGGIAFLIFSLFITILIWAGFMGLLGRVRERPSARLKLDIAAILVTIGAWLAYALL
jgi:hypothetical protein